jgi:glutathionylspermidine synthase
VRRRVVFDCCKWDPQVEDVATLARFPLLIESETWRRLAALAEALARETLAAEAELLRRPELHSALGLPRAARAALRRALPDTPSSGIARLIRFDFHLTPEGWRISEANTDVPGGLNEASGFATLMAERYSGTSVTGDPAGAYADALTRTLPPAPRLALVHATAYSDDHQVMRYLARRLAERGAETVLVSPAHLRWPDGRAHLAADWARGPIDALVRFFPAEWLPNLPRFTDWQRFFGGGRTPASNPAAALLTQSKRFPLVWDALRTPLPTWRRLLPETRDPREVPWRSGDEWVVKPALGRVGEGVGMPGATGAKEWRQIGRDIFWHAPHWAAQRRFEATPVATADGARFPCIGVYTVDERAAGAYGRLAARPIIDSRSQDVAVLLEDAIA